LIHREPHVLAPRGSHDILLGVILGLDILAL
jgi:hypothetical protein